MKRKACGLCGKAGGKLRKTECCDNWVCNDYHKYRLFSYALNSCSRNHDRYSACSYHFIESHPGEWQDCIQCKENVVNDDFPINEAYYERKPRVSKVNILLIIIILLNFIQLKLILKRADIKA